ncbi:MAG: PD-(D/E)XK nuclease family protein [Eubacterium sp.]|nr:PD-(D/E)XK nuclease family protein [Eubacterium sp.]
MLNIYYGRESVDKEKFIYEMIKERGFSAASPVLVLVPDQYTLEAERRAFQVIGRDALIGLDVYSISRLEHNVIADVGQGDVSFIDKYGRQMLLTGVLSELKDDLEVYGGSVRKPAFIEMLNDYISQLKQYDVSPELYKETAYGLESDDALSLKMRDISRIYTAYDKRISGKYTDSEDYVELFLNKADESGLLRKSSVWVYGFDSFAPKALKVLGKLMRLCTEVNVVLTYDEGAADEALFELTGAVRDNLIAAAEENGAERGVIRSIAGMFADGRYKVKKSSAEIEHLEHELYSVMPRPMKSPDAEGGITIIESANYYNEAESAAAYILHLLRDKGYRYRDIAVICNDSDSRGAALEHAFDEYGLPAFIDKKRSISGSGIAVCISAMINACIHGMRTQDIFRALKTGLCVLDQEDTEKLENYAVCYRIDRKLWNRAFTFGTDRYSEEELSELERSRMIVTGTFGKLSDLLKKKQSYAEFLKDFYRFLTEDMALVCRLDSLVNAREESGLRDIAEETVQIWQQILSILDQVNAILGDERFDSEEFLNIFTVGLRQSEIGIMPTSPDDLVVGTMQRTRVGSVKAIVVVGANDGVIPQGGSGSGLFAEQEEERLAESGFEACKSEKVRREEERLAIYRNFSKPDSELWISYTASDESGSALRPSELIEDLLRIFPDKKTGHDILNTGKAEDLIGGRTSTLRHLADAKVKKREGADLDPIWDDVLGWYRSNEPETAASMISGLGFDNRAYPVGEGLSGIMLSGRDSDTVSASRLESYAGCPFRYFIDYGLKPEERRIFETGLREIGDVYHDSLMKITSELSEHGLWDTVTPEQLGEMIHRIAGAERQEYGDGVFHYTGSDTYRADRVEKTLMEAVEVLVRHARAGRIAGSRYEQVFGRRSDIPPVEVDAGGKKIYIEGKIDRLDLLENGRVKIIDYKSGQKTLTDQTIRAGYSLQLMLYMKAAQEGKREPAGVFYFYLGTKDINTDDLKGPSIADDTDPEAVSAKRAPSMQGIVVDDPETISEILGDDTTGSIASIKPGKDGVYRGTNNNMVLAEGDFFDLQQAVDDKVQELAAGIREGRIDIHPMRRKGERIACEYCPYLSICRFDTGFTGCRYNDID